MANHDREERLAREFLRCRAAWTNERWQIVGRPDRAEREQTACDFALQRESDGADGVLELFQLRRGEKSGAEDAIWTRVVVPMEEAFHGQLPGTFTLTTDARIEVSKLTAHTVADTLRRTIAPGAASLDVGQFVLLEGLPFKARLDEIRSEGSSLAVQRFAGATSSHESIERLLDSHSERLDVAKREGNTTILVVEDLDWTIRSDWNAVAEAVRVAAGRLGIQADEIVLVQTHAASARSERIGTAYQIRRSENGYSKPLTRYAPPLRVEHEPSVDGRFY